MLTDPCLSILHLLFANRSVSVYTASVSAFSLSPVCLYYECMMFIRDDTQRMSSCQVRVDVDDGLLQR